MITPFPRERTEGLPSGPVAAITAFDIEGLLGR